MPLRPTMRSAFVLILLLVAYAVCLARLPPRLTLSTDESMYVRQAVAYAQGERTVEVRDALTWETRRELPSSYPPGISLVQAPFVRLGGWPAAAWASFCGLVGLTWVTARWLKDLQLPISFAALVVAYPPAAVLARTGMGDLPSAAVVVASLWLLLRPGPSTVLRIAAGGALAGVSLLLRDSNPIIVAPAVLGAYARGPHRLVLVTTTLLGLCIRPIAAHILQGDLIVLRTPYPFSLDGAAGRLLFYGAALLLFVPGGLLAVWRYRGPRRIEISSTVVGTLIFFSIYGYSAQASGFLKSLVLGPRYLIPVVPLVTVALTWWVSESQLAPRAKRVVGYAVVASAFAMAVAVHPVLDSWSAKQSELVNALYRETSPEAVLITEPGATGKYVNELYGTRVYIDKLRVEPALVAALSLQRPVQLVFIDRLDSDYWRTTTERNEEYVRKVALRCVLRDRIDLTSVDRLRVLDVERCTR